MTISLPLRTEDWGERLNEVHNEMRNEIRTARLTLVPLGVEHAAELAGVLNDPALHAFIGGAPETAAELRTRYARWAAGSSDPAVRWLNWAIRFDAAGALVGTVQATVDIAPAEQAGTAQTAVEGARAELAWVVGTAWQGRGFATEAARGLLAWLVENGVGTVRAHVHPANTLSARVAAALGLRPTGHQQDGEDEWAYTVSN